MNDGSSASFRHTGRVIDFGEALQDLSVDQAQWSQATFGTDQVMEWEIIE